MCPTSLPTASGPDTLSFLAEVVGPSVAKGAIIRRAAVVGLAERLELDRRAVRRMQRLHERYGPGPLMLRLPGAPRAVILEPAHVTRVLEQSPDPFSPATPEKRAALAQFEPHGVLVSRGAAREDRRRYNEAVLEPERPLHHLADRFLQVVREEIGGALDGLDGRPLGWPDFTPPWFRTVRRLVLGDGARDDVELTRRLDRLRAAGNWAMLRPVRRRLRAKFFARLERYLARAESGSLAAIMALVPSGRRTAPEHQVPQWLFAFDAAAIATFRALALAAAHPAAAEAAAGEPPPWPHRRALLLESLRLWPTTPLVLRQTTRPTEWERGTMPAGTGVVIFAPYFHRDERRLPQADRLAVGLWTGEESAGDWPLIPFSRGPAECPGRHLALLVGTAALGEALGRGPVRLVPPERLEPGAPLPGTLNHASLRFQLGPAG